MIKKLSFSCFIVFVFSCSTNNRKVDFKAKLNGKSFKIINSGIDEDIDFRDSTYIYYGLMLTEKKYRIENINDTIGRLFLGNEETKIIESNISSYDFMIIGERLKDTLLLKNNETILDLNEIHGQWIENPNLKYIISSGYISMILNDSILKQSLLKMSQTNKYLQFSLSHANHKIEHLWKITQIMSDTLVISKSYYHKEGVSTVNNVKLIKKN